MEKVKKFRIQFLKFVKRKTHVEYLIRLICPDDSTINLEFFERYSKMLELHILLKKESISKNFPNFPEKCYLFWKNSDENFLNERLIELQHYFSLIFNSEEFSQLKTLNEWVENLIKKYNQLQPKKEKKEENESLKKSPTIKNQGAENNKIDPSINHSAKFKDIQKLKQIIDLVSKNFIDLDYSNDFQADEEEEKRKEKLYKNIMSKSNILDTGYERSDSFNKKENFVRDEMNEFQIKTREQFGIENLIINFS